MKKILILSLFFNFLYSGEKRDLDLKYDSTLKRVHHLSIGSKKDIFELLDVNPSVKKEVVLNQIRKRKSEDEKLGWLLYGLPDDLKDEILGHYFDNFFKDGNITYQELISKIQPFISLNSDNSDCYKMGKEAFENYVVDRYCKDFDFFKACSSRRGFLIELFGVDDFWEVQKSANTEKLKRFLSSNNQVTDSNFKTIKYGLLYYKKNSLLDLYRVVIKTVELVPDEFKRNFNREIIFEMDKYYSCFNNNTATTLRHLCESSLKSEVFKKAVMSNGYLNNDINFQRFKTEFEKLNKYNKMSWVRIVSDIDIDIALRLYSCVESDLEVLLRIKKVSSDMFDFILNKDVDNCTIEELVELLKPFENVSEDLKQDLFFVLSKRVWDEGGKTSTNIEAFVNALWPNIISSQKAELGQKVSEKLLSLDERNFGFFEVAAVLLRYASDEIKRDYIQKTLEKFDKYYGKDRCMISAKIEELAERLGLSC